MHGGPFISLVGSAALALISSAQDETALIVDGEQHSCISLTAIFYADIAIDSPTPASTNNHGSGHLDEPTN
jgi:hypothetical protein